MIDATQSRPGLRLGGEFIENHTPPSSEAQAALVWLREAVDVAPRGELPMTAEVWDRVRVGGLSAVSVLISDSKDKDVLSATDGGWILTAERDSPAEVESLVDMLRIAGVPLTALDCTNLEDGPELEL